MHAATTTAPPKRPRPPFRRGRSFARRCVGVAVSISLAPVVNPHLGRLGYEATMAILGRGPAARGRSVDDQHSPTVLRPGILVRAEHGRTLLAVADRPHTRGRHAECGEIVPNGDGAALAQRQVVFPCATLVGMALDRNGKARVLLEPLRPLLDLLPRLRREIVTIEAPVNSGTVVPDQICLCARLRPADCRAPARVVLLLLDPRGLRAGIGGRRRSPSLFRNRPARAQQENSADKPQTPQPHLRCSCKCPLPPLPEPVRSGITGNVCATQGGIAAAASFLLISPSIHKPLRRITEKAATRRGRKHLQASELREDSTPSRRRNTGRFGRCHVNRTASA